MRGLAVILRKDLTEARRTWRGWVLPAAILFAAVTGPLVAKYAATLVSSSLTGLKIELPDPTWTDSYGQWSKSLSQIIIFIVIVIGATSLGSQIRSGAASALLVRPLDRSAIIAATFLADAAVLAVSTCLGTLIIYCETLAIFGEAPLSTLIQASGLWLCGALMILAAALAASTALPIGGAIACGFGLYLIAVFGATWEPAATWTPAGALSGSGGFAAALSCLVAACAFLTLGTWLLNRREYR